MPMRVLRVAFATAVILVITATVSAQQGKRPLGVDDIYNLREVRDPQRSPDGKWVAYTVTRAIKDTDKNDTDVWMVSWDGKDQIQVTSTPESESTPRWSPDGKYLSFLSSRQGAKRAQVWLLNRSGGEAVKLTDVKGGVSDYAWSPDSRQLALVVKDPDPRDPPEDEKEHEKRPDGSTKTPKPIVVDRYAFKRDGDGYLRGERSHIYLFDVAAKKAELLTPGSYDEEGPSWSPDGKRIAFLRRHGQGDVDRAPNRDLFVMEACTCANPTQLTFTTAEEGGRPEWSPDGKSIAYLLGDELKWSAYDQAQLMVVPAAGGTPKTLTSSLDRPVSSPVWSREGASLTFVVVDDRSQHVARVPAAGGTVQKMIEGRQVIERLSQGPDDSFAVLASTATSTPEVHALENGKLRKLTHQNDEWLNQRLLGTTEEFTSTSKDGTEVHGLIVKPASYEAVRRYPTLL